MIANRLMPVAAIALGSNLDSTFGDPAANLREAIRRIGELGCVAAVSSFYRTEPVGYTEQPDFLNAALLLETRTGAYDLMSALLGIELALGRDRSSAPPKGPRVIDLDLLLYDSLILDSGPGKREVRDGEPGDDGRPALTLPHREMSTRRFVLEPLAEIAPALVHPVAGQTIAQLLAALG